jgi:hypothetical protein
LRRAVAEALHSLQFDTVLGRIGFDEKGDVTGYDLTSGMPGTAANSHR